MGSGRKVIVGDVWVSIDPKTSGTEIEITHNTNNGLIGFYEIGDVTRTQFVIRHDEFKRTFKYSRTL
jgi:hypothetical protein